MLLDISSLDHFGEDPRFEVVYELATLDDAYEVPKALANVDRFLADSSYFALFNCMGTP